MNIRIGHGYDVHQLTEDRDLIIGGVNIPHHLGLLGHSDADVLLHAISDSLLGALALGDIGKHFPDTDDEYKGADSLELLACVYELVKANEPDGVMTTAGLVTTDRSVVVDKRNVMPYRDGYYSISLN